MQNEHDIHNNKGSVREGVQLEHKALRDEILKRIEMRQQIIAVSLTLAGIFLGVGLTRESVPLIYPPLAGFLALGWAQNEFRIRIAARYIRERLESSSPDLGYETHTQAERDTKKGGLGAPRFIVLSHGGIFLITQLMAIGIEFTRWPFKTLQWVLLGIDSVAVVVVILVMRETLRK